MAKSKSLINIILENAELAAYIEKGDFYPVYQALGNKEAGVFTEQCLQAGINPLEYMEKIPSYYIGYSSDSSSIIISRKIRVIESRALFYTSLTEFSYEGTIQEFENIEKEPFWISPAVNYIHCIDGDYKSPCYHNSIAQSLNTTLQMQTGTTLPDINLTAEGTVFYNVATQEVYVALKSTWIRVNDVSVNQNPQYVSAGNKVIAISSPTIEVHW